MALRKHPLGRPATWEDLYRVPETMVGEIVDGDLVLLPPPALPHQFTAHEASVELELRFGRRGTGGWILLAEPYIKVGRDVRAPDIAGWRRERFTSWHKEGPVEIVPDWLCEVLSPSTATYDRTNKLALYHRWGVAHVWVVHPLERWVEVLARDDESWRLVGNFGGTEKARMPPFDDAEIDLANLWMPGTEPPEGAEE